MASLTQWTWVWANSRRQRTGKPGMSTELQSWTQLSNWKSKMQQNVLFGSKQLPQEVWRKDSLTL